MQRWHRSRLPSRPTPASEEALRAFNLGRRVWRTAAHVVAIVATAPTAVAASPRPGKGGAEFGGSSDGGALPPAMRDECRVAFAQFDVNGDGKISLNELRTAMRKLGAFHDAFIGRVQQARSPACRGQWACGSRGAAE